MLKLASLAALLVLSVWLAQPATGEPAHSPTGPGRRALRRRLPGAAEYAQSPLLKGADNRQFPGTYPNDLREDPPMVAAYRQFVEAAEATSPTVSGSGAGASDGSPALHVAASGEQPARSTRSAGMPPTGGGVPVTVGFSLLAMGIAVKRLVFRAFGFRRTPRNC